jgi:hypothetical protein
LTSISPERSAPGDRSKKLIDCHKLGQLMKSAIQGYKAGKLDLCGIATFLKKKKDSFVYLFNIVKGKVVPFIFGGWILFRFVVIYSNK